MGACIIRKMVIAYPGAEIVSINNEHGLKIALRTVVNSAHNYGHFVFHLETHNLKKEKSHVIRTMMFCTRFSDQSYKLNIIMKTYR